MVHLPQLKKERLLSINDSNRSFLLFIQLFFDKSQMYAGIDYVHQPSLLVAKLI